MGAVTTHGLTKDFRTGFWKSRPTRALDAVSIDVPAGGVFGLLGSNGAGKSTALKLLVGILRPTAGSASILGGPAGTIDVHRRLGFLPENPTFPDRLTAEELLRYFAGLFGYTGADCRRRAARVLDLVGIGDERARPVRQYSKGMIQRVGLAQALVNDPEVVLLDEPLSGLDPIGRRQMLMLVADLGAEGRTVLVSSHILSDAEEICQHVAILSRGRLVLSGRTAELTSDRLKGWRLTFRGQGAPRAAEFSPWSIERLDDRRFAVMLAADQRPEPVVADLAAAGAELESVTPQSETLEDVYMRALGGAGREATASDRGDAVGARS